MSKAKKVNLAIVGATGLVGSKILEVLQEFDIKINKLYLFASSKSAGKQIEFKQKIYKVIELTEENINKVQTDFALFSAGGEISEKFAAIFTKAGATVIDNSSFFRMKNDVPLVVPEVNAHLITQNAKIIANPNCSTIQAVVTLAPLHKLYKIKRIIISSYQAVSGAGQMGINDLLQGVEGLPPQKFKKPIHLNLIPHIDDFVLDDYTKEEMKLVNETKKILNDDTIKVTATCVRVPVLYGHSESINVEFESDFDLNEIKQVLSSSESVILQDNPQNLVYPTPLDVEGKNEVFVGRVRRDNTVKSGLNIWVVADNVRKGAATNAVQILKILINNKNKTK